MFEGAFAAVSKEIVDAFIEETELLKAGMIDEDKPHYNEKALTLFLLLRFWANSSFEIHTNEDELCELLFMKPRDKNKKDIMMNLRKMEEDTYLHIRQNPNNKFFLIELNYEYFMPENNFTIIYKKEFDELLPEKTSDRLVILLYCIKKYQYKKTGISFPSIETIVKDTGQSRSAVCRNLAKMDKVLNTYKAIINFDNDTFKEITYYKSVCDGEISKGLIENIAKVQFKNIKSITKKE